MSLGRRRAPVVFDLPGLTAAQLPEVVAARQPALRQARLWMQCRPDGAVRARALGGPNLPALLHARAEDAPGGVRLTGEARESWLLPSTFLVLSAAAVLLAAVALAPATERTGVLVCGIGAVVLAAIALLIARLRPRVFRSDLDELHERLPHVLGAPRT